MSTAPDFADLAARGARGGRTGRLRRAAARINPRLILAAAVVTMAVLAWTVLEILNTFRDDDPLGHLAVSLASILAAVVTVFPALLLADAAVDDGVSRWRAYGGAGAATVAISLPLQIAVAAWLPASLHAQPLTPHEHAALFIEGSVHWIIAIVAVHAGLRNSLDASERIGRLQLERARSRRALMEDRVRAAQARVDPRFLLGAMRHVGIVHVDDAQRATQALECLIAWLRAAMPHADQARSTIARELALAAAYLDLRMALALPDALAFDLLAEPTLGRAALPPMLMVPMIEWVLGDVAPAMTRGHLVARVERAGAGLRLRVEAAEQPAGVGAPCEARLAALRERTRELLGDEARLVPEVTPAALRLTLEWPHAEYDRDPR